jgi:exodeoxyribonuclease V beta subunit
MTGPFEANRFPLLPGLRLLEASAGTGKTFALAHLVLRFVAEAELSLRQLLVVTFTEAAAAELRDRIGRRLQQALNNLEHPEQTPPDSTLSEWLELQRPHTSGLQARLLLALEDLDAADITTIHGFCRRTLQRQSMEAGQPPEFQLDSDAGLLVQQVSHDYWQQQVLPLPTHLVAGLQRGGAGPDLLADLLAQLDGDPALQLDPLPSELDAERPLAGQLEHLWAATWRRFLELWRLHSHDLNTDLQCIAAQWRAQGIRKTDPYAARARRDRVGEVDGWLADQPEQGDYGALMARQGGGELLHTFFHPGAFLKVARPLEGSGDTDPSLPQQPLLNAIAQLVDGPAEATLLHAAHWGRAELRRRRQRSGQLGFSQLLEGLDPADQVGTPLLEAVGQRYAAALIDEFQDTDPIQWRILSRAFRADRHRLVLVGDPKQAIYRFRGGELATYLTARRAAATSGGVSQLAENHRSTAALITALNGLMAPGLRRSGLEVPEVSACAQVEPLSLDQDTTSVELLWLGGDRQAGVKAPSRTSLDQHLPGQIASYTAALLERGCSSGLGPDQICLLVSTHRQAEALRQALERSGIASRLVSKGDVFESAGATALQRLLDALASPGEGRRLRLLAASPLLGWSAAEIAAAPLERWSDLAGQLAGLADQLTRRGLPGVLASLLEEQGVARLSLGGRLLADLQQCAELVQERLHTDQLGPAAAADWLRRLRLDPDRQVPDSHEPYSDVVDEAVSVVTVHRSKGLEYPVVICPYLWQAPSGSSAGRPWAGARWHPTEADEPRLDLHRNRFWGQGYAARRAQFQAELEERERLAYVAATRAQRLLVLAWGPAAGQQGNPLHPWLFSRQPLPDPECDPYTAQSDADWLGHLNREISERALPMRLVNPHPAGEVVVCRSRREAPATPLRCGPSPQRRLDSGWGRSSYSSWTQGSHQTSPSALDEGRETDDRSQDPQPGEWAETGSGDPAAALGPLADFPRGAQAGDCLHRILERLDFQTPLDLQTDLCLDELQRAGIAHQHLAGLLAGLERLRRLPLAGPLKHLRLADLPPQERLHELNFDIPLASVQASDLARVFANHPKGAFGGAYAKQLANLPVACRGFLTGSIDLVFAHQGRWWVLDWKSNWLGERDNEGGVVGCGPRYYGSASLTTLMAANHYPLQAHLYLVALHRYLGWRLPGYQPENHLGGYIYVFLRGLPDPEGRTTTSDTGTTGSERNDPVPGLFLDQPPLERLLALDRVLAGPTAAEDGR